MYRVSLVSLFLAGCGTSGLSSLTAAEQLLLSTTSGAEEKQVSSGSSSTPDDIPADQRPDAFRSCDAASTYSDLFGRFDANSDGNLDTTESKEEQSGWEGQSFDAEQRLMMQWGMLLLAYDADSSGTLEEGERAVLLDDFTVRCTALQSLLTEQFDADGDGSLSTEEQATAQAFLDEQAAEHHPDCNGGMMEGDRPEGGPPMGKFPDDVQTVGGVPIAPPLMDEFDADGDGSLSDSEIATLRESLRARIREGAPLMPPPPDMHE